MEYFLVLAIPALFIALAIAAYLRGRGLRIARRRELHAAAAAMGLRTATPEAIPESVRSSVLLKAGFWPGVGNVMTGIVDGESACFFDLMFTRWLPLGWCGRYENTTSACAVRLGIQTGSLMVRPDDLADKAASLAGFHDIEFDDSRFDDCFHVKAHSESFARAVLGERVRRFLLDRPGATMEIVDGWLLLYHMTRNVRFWYSKALSAENSLRLIEDALTLAALLRESIES